MAINKNHEFEELDGVRCAIVEKNVLRQRADFLKAVLSTNNYEVVIVASAPAKSAPTAAAKTMAESIPPASPAPATFTVGVTDVTFNPINAVFGRLLKTKEGRVVTLAYWQQKQAVANDEIPYFESKV